MTLLKMSIYGAVIILAVLIIRAITLHKLPKKTFLILWAVALVRLLVPFEISSDYSLYSLLPEDNNPITEDNPISVGQNSSGAIYLPKDNFEPEAIPLPDMETVAAYTKAPVSGSAGNSNNGGPQKLLQDVLPYLPIIWAAGASLCAAFYLLSYVRCRGEFCTSLPVTEDYAAEWLRQHPVKRTITIRQSDKISAPLTYGIFHPVILLPKKTDWTNLTQLDYVLYHEFTHIRRFDLAAKLIMIATLCIHWFNPFVWAMYIFFNRDLELSCDDCVVRHFGETKSAYAGTLIGMEEKRNYGTPLCNHFSKNAIEERITAIMKSKKTTIGMIIAAIVIIAIVVVTLTTGRKEDVVTDITPTPTETITPSAALTPSGTEAAFSEPTHAPGAIIYSPERNYTYHEDDLAKFNYNNGTVSPTDGYDFAISTLVSTKGEPVLSDVTVNLEAYAGNTAWWCLAAFYDEEAGNVYLEFVPAAGVEDAPSGIIHVTIPVTDPAAYTVHPAGDFHAQKASAFWFSDICKVKDKIYFNNGSCNGSLWVYDIATGEMTDLTYVNEKMQDLANELCAGFGWENEPAVWFNVGWHDNGITTYEANICKEMDTGTFFIMRVYYQDDLYLDYNYSYKGAQKEPPTQEELNTRIQELFFRYKNMQDELFNTGLKTASVSSADDRITINGKEGYLRVTDERFPNMKSVTDYMETICTHRLALNLRLKNWKVTTTEPVVTEYNGMLYSQCYDGILFDEDYRFSPVSIDSPDTCTLSYEAYINIPSNKTETGIMYFQYIDGNWYVWHHEYTYHTMTATDVYEEQPASGAVPTTDGPDWYNSVSALMHGITPENTVELPRDTVVPDDVISTLKTQAASYLGQCGLGIKHHADCYAVCETDGYIVYAADISYSDSYEAPIYFTVYHAYDGTSLADTSILRHQITFYDAENQSHVWANYITMDNVVSMAKEELEQFYDTKNYSRPYEITSIHMTSFHTMEVKFLIPEAGRPELHSEATVEFIYDFTTEEWSVSCFEVHATADSQ